MTFNFNIKLTSNKIVKNVVSYRTGTIPPIHIIEWELASVYIFSEVCSLLPDWQMHKGEKQKSDHADENSRVPFKTY